MRAGRFRSVSSLQGVPLAFVGRTSPFLGGQRTSSSGKFFCFCLPLLLNGGVLSPVAATPPDSQFSYGDGSFCSVFSPANGFWYVDKTDHIPKLEALKAKAIVSLRPRRMGKTLWKDTLAHYYDVAQKDQLKELFGHLEIGKAPTALANTFFVLPLTFAGLKTDTVEEFKASLNDHLNTKAASFKEKYNLSFTPNDQNALDTFERLVEEMKRKKEKVKLSSPPPPFPTADSHFSDELKLYVSIDEYDVSINKALGNRDFVSALQVSNRNPLQRMENMYAEFFSKVKTACDDNVARCFITGVTPLALNEFTSGFNIARHITSDLEFASLYGFTEADVQNGLARLKLTEPVVARIVESWRYNHNGYLFDPRQKVTLYNPTRVLHGLSQLERALRLDPPPSTLQPEKQANYLLEQITRDSNSLPAEATLEAIKSNPNASTVIAEALSADDAVLKCGERVQVNFRLSHMNELAIDRQALHAFMFYNGALTYAPFVGAERIYNLRIPNNVAREEFAKELEKRIGLDQTGYQSLREAVITMLDTKKIDSFCEAVSKYLLSGLAGRDVKGGEDPFAQGKKNQVLPCVFELTLKVSAVYDAMALARRPTDSVHKEYKVDSVARASGTKGSAADVVYIQSTTSVKQPQQVILNFSPPPPLGTWVIVNLISCNKQYYCFSFKNIRVQALELAKTEDERRIEDNWEKLCEISRRELDDETKVSDDDILGLPLNVAFMKQYKRGDTVKTVLEKAVQEARSTHLPPLQKEIGQANVHCWVLVRVGTRRIIWKQVTV
jgi:hypothetical protein